MTMSDRLDKPLNEYSRGTFATSISTLIHPTPASEQYQTAPLSSGVQSAPLSSRGSSPACLHAREQRGICFFGIRVNSCHPERVCERRISLFPWLRRPPDRSPSGAPWYLHQTAPLSSGVRTATLSSRGSSPACLHAGEQRGICFGGIRVSSLSS